MTASHTGLEGSDAGVAALTKRDFVQTRSRVHGTERRMRPEIRKQVEFFVGQSQRVCVPTVRDIVAAWLLCGLIGVAALAPTEAPDVGAVAPLAAHAAAAGRHTGCIRSGHHALTTWPPASCCPRRCSTDQFACMKTSREACRRNLRACCLAAPPSHDQTGASNV
jgi:hypothetical protein